MRGKQGTAVRISLLKSGFGNNQTRRAAAMLRLQWRRRRRRRWLWLWGINLPSITPRHALSHYAPANSDLSHLYSEGSCLRTFFVSAVRWWTTKSGMKKRVAQCWLSRISRPLHQFPRKVCELVYQLYSNHLRCSHREGCCGKHVVGKNIWTWERKEVKKADGKGTVNPLNTELNPICQ